MVYKAISMLARARKDDGVPYDYYKEPDESNAEGLSRKQSEREYDLMNNPAYHHLPGNIWHEKMKCKDDEDP